MPLKWVPPDSPMGNKMSISKLLVIAICFLGPISCFAQCAPGIPSAGNPGCIPPTAPGSPYGVPDANAPADVPLPQQNVQWADSWGAIAYDRVEVKAGNAEDQPSKEVASRVAMDYCQRYGGKQCQVVITYYNQCVSAAQPTEGLGDIRFSTAAEQEDADQRALRACGSGCVTVLRKCSLPKRIN